LFVLTESDALILILSARQHPLPGGGRRTDSGWLPEDFVIRSFLDARDHDDGGGGRVGLGGDAAQRTPRRGGAAARTVAAPATARPARLDRPIWLNTPLGEEGAVLTALDDVATKKQVEQSAEQQAAVELVRLAQEEGLSLTGPDGLLKQLTKTVLETAATKSHRWLGLWHTATRRPQALTP
jgi:hypothetical protein